jgi:hypothetical protein
MKRRSPEHGGITLVVAAAFIMLFGLAALAVDVGASYTRRLGLQAVADAAALGGARGGISTARASSIALKNGYSGAAVTVTNPYNSKSEQIHVKITASQPAFFSLLGSSARNISAEATAVGLIPVPAILALGSACGDAGSVRINNPAITITGNVASAGGIIYNNVGIQTLGSATYENNLCSGSTDAGSYVRDGFGSGPIGDDPFVAAVAALPACTKGTLTSGASTFNAGDGDGVFCSGGKLDYDWSSNVTRTITLIAKGQINISGSVGTLVASWGGFIAYSTAALDCPLSQAINVGSGGITLKGSFYAPNGCLNVNANTMTIEGALIGKAVQIQGGSTSTLTGPAGSSTGKAYLVE